MNAGMIGGDDKFIDDDGVWRWRDSTRALTPAEMIRQGLYDTPSPSLASAGWCAPAAEYAIVAPPALDFVELPVMSVGRGGFRWPTNIHTVVSFHVERPRLGRWRVHATITKTWTLGEEAQSRTFDLIVARTFRRSAAYATRNRLAGALQ